MVRKLHKRVRPSRRSLSSRGLRLSLERLEERCLLDAGLVDGIWTIQGSLGSAGDRVQIERDPSGEILQAYVNGQLENEQLASDVVQIQIVTGAGRDQVRVNESILIPTQIDTGAGNDAVFGGGGDDVIAGGAGKDIIWGRDGNDILAGGDGRDFLYGGSGNDQLFGEAGNDVLVGNGTVGGLPGAMDDDLLDGGPGTNSLNGSGGQDTLVSGSSLTRPTEFSSADEIQQHILNEGLRRYQGLFGQRWFGFYDLPVFSTSTSSGEVPPEHSDTTLQEQGVDEGDLVKTDGQYIYFLTNGRLAIVNAWPPSDLSVLSQTTIEGQPIAMYLTGQRVTVLSRIDPPYDPGLPIPIDPGFGGGGIGIGIPFPIFFEPPAPTEPPRVKITVFDVVDPTAPRVTKETYLEGSYISSRVVGDRVYIVLSNDDWIPRPELLPDPDGGYVYETAEEYQQRVLSQPATDLLPQFTSRWTDASGPQEQTGPLSEAENIFQAGVGTTDTNLLSVVALDIPTDYALPVSSVTFEAPYNSIVYASTTSIYLASSNFSFTGYSTRLHKVELNENGVDLTAIGEVPGTLLNQFSVDEEGSFLRIATTIGWGMSSTNNVYILAEEEGMLNVVGNIEDLALGERIFSARFFDDRGFVVTFRQVDPLYALNLGDPLMPEVAGELHIPGFSRYLQPISATHIIGIGRNATPTGMTLGLQVSLFDVSDLSNPTLVHRYDIATPSGWSWSPGEYDHHAVSYFSDQGVLALPISGSVQVPRPGGGFTWQSRHELLVLQVDPSAGFTLVGQVTHSSAVLRSLRIGEVLYSITTDTIRAQPLFDPTAMIAEVRVTP